MQIVSSQFYTETGNIHQFFTFVCLQAIFFYSLVLCLAMYRSTQGTLDASDSKCEDLNHVCCKHPKMEVKKCTPENRVKDKPAEVKKLEELKFRNQTQTKMVVWNFLVF